MKNENRYAHVFAYRTGRPRLYIVNEREIREEYHERSAMRNDRLEDDSDIEDVVEWLEVTLDDGMLRRYGPLDIARDHGIRACRYGHDAHYSAADVRDLLGEVRHGECADCGEPGPIVDTPSGESFSGEGSNLGRVSLASGDVYLCGSQHNGDPVCDACENERDEARTEGGAQ